MFCCTLLCVLSSFAVILMKKRADCFLMVPWVGLQCVILVLYDDTHLLFYTHHEWDVGYYAISRTYTEQK